MQNYFTSLNRSFFFFVLFVFALSHTVKATVNDTLPNILLIISDDIGVDVTNGYHEANLMPTTPTLDSLRSVGITFENVWAAPVCSPTRATIMTGKHGIKNGVLGVPGNLTLNHTTIFQELASQTNNAYTDALIGKHHLSSPADPNHPLDLGPDFYSGFLGGGAGDYFAWPKTENGVTNIDSTYTTIDLTNSAIDWIDQQSQVDQPWMLWLAHGAAHSPFHEPPSHMYSIQATGTNFRKYIAMIESLDYEINRLLYSMPDSVRENTLVIYIGDNGTPGNFIQDYPAGHGKGSVYQGGIRVPMIVAGAGVTRQGVRESALVHVMDLYATILEIAGAELPGGLYNSLSFDHLLKDEPGATRDYNYSEIEGMGGTNAWTIRNEEFKFIQFEDGTQELYNLLEDSLEFNDLMLGTLDAEQLIVVADLEAEALQRRTGWSCRDHIRNGDETGVDCGGSSSCGPCVTNTLETVDLENAIKIYPNPTSLTINIESEAEFIESIKIYNSIGGLLISKSPIESSQVQIGISHLNPQVYFIQIRTAKSIKTEKFLKQ